MKILFLVYNFTLGPKIGMLLREREKGQDVKLLWFSSLNKLNVGPNNKPTMELSFQNCMSQMNSMFNQGFFAIVWSL